MRAETIVRAVTFALIVAGTSILAAPQQTTMTPGQMTQAKVWIQNRGRTEALPVDLQTVNLDAPLRVQVMNGDPALSRATPVQVAPVRPLWDYKTITVQPADDMTALLNAQGMNGWDTTGIWSADRDGVKSLLLKRPR
jgi:hypothetical protein